MADVFAGVPQDHGIDLNGCRAVFQRWLGQDYDLDALDAMLTAAAVERLDGDPLWLLIISGSGNAKTESVQALSGIGAKVVSTITSEGALLSATAKRERRKDATGGLLREIGDRGVLVIKDVTSILSMSRELRGQVLGALREIHDGVMGPQGWHRRRPEPALGRSDSHHRRGHNSLGHPSRRYPSYG
jgi:hypothetical protein